MYINILTPLAILVISRSFVLLFTPYIQWTLLKRLSVALSIPVLSIFSICGVFISLKTVRYLRPLYQYLTQKESGSTPPSAFRLPEKFSYEKADLYNEACTCVLKIPRYLITTCVSLWVLGTLVFYAGYNWTPAHHIPLAWTLCHTSLSGLIGALFANVLIHVVLQDVRQQLNITSFDRNNLDFFSVHKTKIHTVSFFLYILVYLLYQGNYFRLMPVQEWMFPYGPSVGTAVFLFLLLSALFTRLTRLDSDFQRELLLQKMQEIADHGSDLTKRVSIVEYDQLGALAAQFNQVIIVLQNIINKAALISLDIEKIGNDFSVHAERISDEGRVLGSGAIELSASGESFSETINTIAAAAVQISEFSESLSEKTTDAAGAMADAAASTEHLTSSAADIAEKSQEMSELSRQCRERTDNVLQMIRVIDEEGQNIGRFSSVIKRLGEKTNLLALNATLEASAAGKTGKGFSVVASEIKEMAWGSSKAADDITKRILIIREAITHAVSVINNLSLSITGMENDTEVITALTGKQTETAAFVSKNISSLSKNAAEIARTISETSEGMRAISKNVSLCADASSRIADGLKKFSASLAEQAAHSEKTKHSAEDLISVIPELYSLVQRFNLLLPSPGISRTHADVKQKNAFI